MKIQTSTAATRTEGEAVADTSGRRAGQLAQGGLGANGGQGRDNDALDIFNQVVGYGRCKQLQAQSWIRNPVLFQSSYCPSALPSNEMLVLALPGCVVPSFSCGPYPFCSIVSKRRCPVCCQLVVIRDWYGHDGYT